MTFLVYYKRCGIPRIAIVNDKQSSTEACEAVKQKYGEHFVEILRWQQIHTDVLEVY